MDSITNNLEELGLRGLEGEDEDQERVVNVRCKIAVMARPLLVFYQHKVKRL